MGVVHDILTPNDRFDPSYFLIFRDENNYKFKFVIENFEKSTYVTRQVFTMQRAKYGVLDSSGER